MKIKLFIISIAFAGLTSCAQRATCPTYAVDHQQEIKMEKKQQEKM